MKKLLITTMAAVSVGLCAKADLTAETFESYGEGSLFGTLPGDSSKYEISDGWETETTLENLFTVTNIVDYVGASTYPKKADRPSNSDSANALAIDTSAPLLRYADSTKDPQSLSDAPIFFDSVVQFTATDVAAEPNSGDKLCVWLYSSAEDVSADAPGLFKETSPITNLVVTAGKYANELNGNPGELSTFNYQVQIDGDVGLKPDTWHRLTIKAIADVNPHEAFYNPVFEIWVDGKPVSYGEKTQFPSLKSGAVQETLQGVAFNGKGAVDDIVFTTTVPEFAKKPEAATANVTITFSNFEAIDGEYGVWYDVNDKSFDILEASTKLELNVGDKISVCFGLLPDYELDSSMNATKHEDGYYVVTIDALTAEGATIAIEIKKAGGSGGVTVGGTSVVIGDDGTIANITTAFDGKAVSGELDTTKFKSYYTVKVENGILSIKLDQKAAAPFAEATDLEDGEEALEVGEDASGNPELTVRIKPYVGLYYGAMTGTALDNLTLTSNYQKATTADVIEFTAKGKAGDTASFIKVVVTDIAPEE